MTREARLHELATEALELKELVTYEIFHEQLKNPSDYECGQYAAKTQTRRREIEANLRAVLVREASAPATFAEQLAAMSCGVQLVTGGTCALPMHHIGFHSPVREASAPPSAEPMNLRKSCLPESEWVLFAATYALHNADLGDWVTFGKAVESRCDERLEAYKAQSERIFQAVVYAYEGREVPADLSSHGMVLRAEKFRQAARGESAQSLPPPHAEEEVVRIARALTNDVVRAAWEAGFRLCRSYGDNHWHWDGEQKEQRWREYLDGVNPIQPLTAAPSLPPPEPEITGETSDGYHTFNELYAYRKAYNAILFNEWAARGRNDVHKSRYHSDGEACFGGGWFIVSAQTPQGQITNHYKDEDWALFNVPERPCAAVWDGHTPAEALRRLLALAAAPSLPPEGWQRFGEIVQNWFARLPMTKDERRKRLGWDDCENLLKRLAAPSSAPWPTKSEKRRTI